ncbi:MAG: hypothetical protein A3I75_07625 [Deltaproteobacteria bacterium RIFCSPLOWO2_02_FULL_50_16]|nr:MAG: hypothetical protein A3B79_06965 [Deltaproteobacteria bacterium RIFCSPHIGHO2_02_FULL_50_15]OGQ57588.1 MAG: hypothetical protein A3I75_07625 [Deltaproteobacteria bacterium RIFCSPLOWO2_02_FULL_50_16]OGQ67003.1 MAG: hypothetical protein A3F89_02270 [Deltaproteobacteria bacterium RIFCSPLOWO2_12_FULL_50_11]
MIPILKYFLAIFFSLLLLSPFGVFAENQKPFKGRCLVEGDQFVRCSLKVLEDSLEVVFKSKEELSIARKDITYITLENLAYQGRKGLIMTTVIGSTHVVVPSISESGQYKYLGIEYQEERIDEKNIVKKVVLMQLDKKSASLAKSQIEALLAPPPPPEEGGEDPQNDGTESSGQVE